MARPLHPAEPGRRDADQGRQWLVEIVFLTAAAFLFVLFFMAAYGLFSEPPEKDQLASGQLASAGDGKAASGLEARMLNAENRLDDLTLQVDSITARNPAYLVWPPRSAQPSPAAFGGRWRLPITQRPRPDRKARDGREDASEPQ